MGDAEETTDNKKITCYAAVDHSDLARFAVPYNYKGIAVINLNVENKIINHDRY